MTSQPVVAVSSRPGRWSLVLAGLLHLLALVPYGFSGLIAPTYGVIGLLVVWLLFAAFLVAVHRRYGALAALVPPVAVLTWIALLSLGGAVLGWQA